MSAKIKVLFIYPNLMMMNMLPPAISIFSAILKKNEFEVDLFDNTYYKTEEKSSDEAKLENLQLRPFNLKERNIDYDGDMEQMFADLRSKVESFGPDLIAISVVEDTFPMGMCLLNSIKRPGGRNQIGLPPWRTNKKTSPQKKVLQCNTIKSYNIPVIVGGVFATFAPHVVIKEEAVDYVCIGEGEEVLLELCKKMRNRENTENIQNLWVKKNGKIIKNRMRPLIDFNKIPFQDYEIFDRRRLFRPMAGKVYRMVPVETHRGCPFQCTYCNSPSQVSIHKDSGSGMFFRKRNIKRIYDELKYQIKKWDFEYIYFHADTFLAWSDKEFDEFIEMYQEFKLPFWMQTRPETITKYKWKKLEEVGCHRVSIGIEHGNENFRKKVIKRSTSNKKIVEAFNIIKNHTIPVTINNVMGFPYETRELTFDTIELNRNLVSDTRNAYAFVPYYGTPLRKICTDNEFIKEDSKTRCLTQETILDMPQYSKKEIEGMMRTFNLYVKLPKSYWPEIAKAERKDEEGNKVFNRLKDFYWKEYN